MTTFERSEAIKSALHEGFKDGTSKLAHRKCFGYDHDADGRLVINPEEAEIVRWMFERFLAGDSFGCISKGLAEEGVSTPSGKAVWSKEAISKLLSNEKYTGKVLLQKTFSDGVVQINNDGLRDRYLYTNSHEAIIDDKMFSAVQKKRENSRYMTIQAVQNMVR